MNKLLTLIAEQPKRTYSVELTESGPVLYQSGLDLTSTNTISTHEIDEATFKELMAILQTGKLDNAKVKEIIEAKQ